MSLCVSLSSEAVFLGTFGEIYSHDKSKSTYQLGALLASKRTGIMGLIPLSERKAVNKDDAVLDQSLGSDQLIVGGIVDHINDPGFPCAAWVHPT